jgi:hypothetical protein
MLCSARPFCVEKELMLRQLLSFGALSVFLLQAPPGASQTTSQTISQMQRMLVTAKATTRDTPNPHPLTWWTQNPLRLDENRSLLVGIKAADGHIISARDYHFEQKVTTLGTISGHRLVEVITTIHDLPSLAKLPDNESSQPSEDAPPTQWKSLLVEADASDRYVEIYRLQAEYGTYLPMTSAIILGTGEDAILRTFDPANGNGGHCSEGYWWFDKSGAHDVDFSPLDRAIAGAQPPATTAWPHCWALASNNYEVRVGVQRTDAKCHGCDWLGEIVATYQIKQGQATPTSIHFVTTSEQ